MNITKNSLVIAASTLFVVGATYTGFAGSCATRRPKKDVAVTCAGGCTPSAWCGSAACPVAKVAKADAKRVECTSNKCGDVAAQPVPCGAGCTVETWCGSATCPVAAVANVDKNTSRKQSGQQGTYAQGDRGSRTQSGQQGNAPAYAQGDRGSRKQGGQQGNAPAYAYAGDRASRRQSGQQAENN